nr:glycosyl hydrolase family 28 protein [Novosphingobium pokkalii]
MRFAPGIHVPPDQPGAVFAFPSHTTVLLEPRAVLRGKVALDRVTDVQILGHGIIDQPERGFEITYSSDITIHDLNTFSAAPWADGTDMMSCADVRVNNVFLRTSDDSVAIYGHRWNFAGDARNITITDAILWAGVAHPINIGLHGGGETAPEVIENIAFRRIDVLEHDEDDPECREAVKRLRTHRAHRIGGKHGTDRHSAQPKGATQPDRQQRHGHRLRKEKAEKKAT